MRIGADLPEDLWPETISAAAYILNRTPTSRTGITPFEALYKFKPTISHMKIYGCKAYPLIYNIPKLEKLQPRAHIGYFVGYSSRNIYRIWVPSKDEVIRIRDVSFDETTYYQLDDVDAGQFVQEQELHQAIQILQEIPESVLANNQDEEELDISTISTTHQADIAPSSAEQPPPKTPPNERQPYLSPPPTTQAEATDPTSTAPSTTTPAGNGEDGNWEYRPVGARAPRSQEISAELSEDSILPTRTRNRRQAHAAVLINLDTLSGYHAAFATDHMATRDHLHRDKLLEEPKYWKQMLKHPHKQYFIQAANKEYNHLKDRGTFKLTSRSTTQSSILPLI